MTNEKRRCQNHKTHKRTQHSSNSLRNKNNQNWSWVKWMRFFSKPPWKVSADCRQEEGCVPWLWDVSLWVWTQVSSSPDFWKQNSEILQKKKKKATIWDYLCLGILHWPFALLILGGLQSSLRLCGRVVLLAIAGVFLRLALEQLSERSLRRWEETNRAERRRHQLPASLRVCGGGGVWTERT